MTAPAVHISAPSRRGTVAVQVGAPHLVLGGALLGGRSATACSARLAAARDPVPRQVRGEVPPT